MQVTREVLEEIGAGDVPWILVLNKIDKVAQTEWEELLKEFPAALLVSAKDPADVQRVRDAILGAFEANMTEVDLVVPYDAGSAIGEVHKVHVISESYEGDGVQPSQGRGVRDRADTGDAALECAAARACFALAAAGDSRIRPYERSRPGDPWGRVSPRTPPGHLPPDS
jgi:hypothetical protein